MKYSHVLISVLVYMLVSLSQNLSAQCDGHCHISCRSQVNVSLGIGCATEFIPSMGAKGVTVADSLCYTAEVFDVHNNPVPYALLTFDHIDQTLYFKVTEADCGNSCWGEVLVEYKLGPQIACPDDTVIDCAALNFLEIDQPVDLCASVSISLINEQHVAIDCDPEIQSQVIRTFRAVDQFGNSGNCTQNIFLRRINENNIIFPGPTLYSCSDPRITLDEDGAPIPFFFQDTINDANSLYGIPFLCTPDMVTPFLCPTVGILGSGGTGSGTGSGTMGGGLLASALRYGIPLFPESGGIIVKSTGDTLSPFTFTEFDDPSVGFYCGAALSFSDTQIPFEIECRRKIFRNWEFFQWNCGQEIAISSLQTIEIIDDTAPIITCPENQLIELDSGCEIDVNLLEADVEDVCDPNVIVTIEIDGQIVDANGGSQLMIGGENQVTYIATDRCDNRDSCMVMVNIIDKINPVALCEDGKIVSLSNDANGVTRVPAEIFDNGSFDDCGIDSIQVRRLDSSCGIGTDEWSDMATFCCDDAFQPEVLLNFRVIDNSGNRNECQVYVVVQDKTTPIITCPPSMTIDCNTSYDVDNLGPVFGFANVQDNCGDRPLFEVLENDFNQCGSGVLSRRIQTIGADGNPTASCTQLINIVDPNPFTANDIIWPEDINIVSRCNLDDVNPEDLGENAVPRFANESCALLGVEFEDQPFSFNPNSSECLIVKRVWTVINWCGSSNGIETFVIPSPQLIRLRSSTPPVMDPGLDVEVRTQNGECDSGQLNIQRSASDDCDEFLVWEYVIEDAFSRDTIAVGESPTIIGKFPVGSYRIFWSVRDRCGNTSRDDQFVNIIPDGAPTPLCLSGISVSINEFDEDSDGIPDSPSVRVWAADVDGGSYPGCSGDILLSFSENIADNNIVFNCANIGVQSINLYATDLLTGSQAFCTGLIEVRDPRGLCDFVGMQDITIEGVVTTEVAQTIEGVDVVLEGTAFSDVTNEEGEYAFTNMLFGGSYTLQADKNRNHAEGVNTIDLIRIQRHVLGIERLDSPYKLIAADINNDQRINGIDLIELRKMVLGVYEAFPDNDSWRFVRSDFMFQDPSNPWLGQMPEEFYIPELLQDTSVDFIGVKIGDVDNTALFVNSDTDLNKKTILDFDAEQLALEQGDIVTVNVTSKAYNQLLGWQGTIEFKPSQLEILEIVPQALGAITMSNFNLTHEQEGWITMSYSSDLPESIEDNEVLFQVIVQARQGISNTDGLLLLSSAQIPSQAYKSDLEIIPMITPVTQSATASLLSISPNPWYSNATIEFETSLEGEVRIEFYDTSGRRLHQVSSIYSIGEHSMTIDRKDLNAKGLIYVRLLTDGQSSEMKMMLYD